MQFGELVAIPQPDPPKEEEKDKTKHINLRISLFYDGTMNNRANVQSRQSTKPDKHQPYLDMLATKKKQFGILDRGHVSYSNDESNVSLLQSYLVARETGNDLHLSVYTEGAGTTNFGHDDVIGAGLGAGGTGIPAKVKKGIEDAQRKIKMPGNGVNPAETIIDTLSIDVFGFSRGAATARHAIHLLKHHESLKISEGANSLGYKAITKVEVRLAGIFDTVASFKSGLFIGNETWRLNLDAVQHARKVLHLAAADEHRANFSLTNIKSKGSFEYFLPGVHSDIGGGYTDGEAESLIIFKGFPQEADREMKRLIDAGWYLEGQITKKDYYAQNSDPYGMQDEKIIARSELHVARPSLPTAYSIIPLKIMARFVMSDGFILNDEYQAKISTINSDAELKNIDAKVDAEYNSATTAEYWTFRDDDWLKSARNKYFHFSAHYNSTGMGPRMVAGQRKRKYYDG